MSPVETGLGWIASVCLTPCARRSPAHPPFEQNVTDVTESGIDLGKATDCERLRERDLTLRTLAVLAARLGLGRAHGERTGRNDHQRWQRGLNGRPRFGTMLGEGRNECGLAVLGRYVCSL